jgi:hypothetical protein
MRNNSQEPARIAIQPIAFQARNAISATLNDPRAFKKQLIVSVVRSSSEGHKLGQVCAEASLIALIPSI